MVCVCGGPIQAHVGFTSKTPRGAAPKMHNRRGARTFAGLAVCAVGAAVLRKRRMDAVEGQSLQYTELPGSAVATNAGPGNGE